MKIEDLPLLVQTVLGVYSPSERAGFLNGTDPISLKNCHCSKCTFLKAYFHLRRGGKYDPDLLNRFSEDDEYHRFILECLCLRAIR